MSDAFTIADLRELLVRAQAIPPTMVLDDPRVSFEDLAVDSSVLLAVRADIQARLGISLEYTDLPDMATVGGSVELINRKLRANF